MAYFIELKTFNDDRGSLTVLEKSLPFQINRIFYIYNVDNSTRGQHRHKKTMQAAICVQGSCRIVSDDSTGYIEYMLDNPSKCLILEPEDWHYMDNFSSNAVLLVLASEHYEANDYIYEPYQASDYDRI